MTRSPCTLPGREGIAGYPHRITLTPYRGVTRCPSVGVHRPARGRHICGACREGFLRHLVFGGAAWVMARCRPVFSRSGPSWAAVSFAYVAGRECPIKVPAARNKTRRPGKTCAQGMGGACRRTRKSPHDGGLSGNYGRTNPELIDGHYPCPVDLVNTHKQSYAPSAA